MTTQLQTRNAELAELVSIFEKQNARRQDLVLPSNKLHAADGNLIVSGVEPVLSEEGVTMADGIYAPTYIADETISAKLSIPLAYLRRLRGEHVELWDQNVNGWLSRDERSFMLRTFKSDDDGQPGVARALLSDRYAIMDNFDALMSALEGIRAAGVAVNIAGADLTERRMVVRVVAPEIQALAPTLLKGYRSPYTGQSGDENPTVFAGFEISNSETGGGAFAITPRLVVQVCNNGMKITKDAMRSVHLGGRLEESTIVWSSNTVEKAQELIRSKTVDAVRTFLDVDFMKGVIERAEAKAAVEVATVDAVKTITKKAMFTEAQTEGILAHFVKGGQMTLGGVYNAATAYVQQVEDADTAFEVELRAAALLSL